MVLTHIIAVFHKRQKYSSAKLALACRPTHVDWLSLQKTVVNNFIFSKAVTLSNFIWSTCGIA